MKGAGQRVYGFVREGNCSSRMKGAVALRNEDCVGVFHVAKVSRWRLCLFVFQLEDNGLQGGLA